MMAKNKEDTGAVPLSKVLVAEESRAVRHVAVRNSFLQGRRFGPLKGRSIDRSKGSKSHYYIYVPLNHVR
jgi:hypothetical protein